MKKYDMFGEGFTLKQVIVEELYWSGNTTDRQLAERLGANLPSVRRARNQLVKSGEVKQGRMTVRPDKNGWVKSWRLSRA